MSHTEVKVLRSLGRRSAHHSLRHFSSFLLCRFWSHHLPRALPLWDSPCCPLFTHSCWGWGFTNPFPTQLGPVLLLNYRTRADTLPLIKLTYLKKLQQMALAGRIMSVLGLVLTQVTQTSFLTIWKDCMRRSLKAGEEEEQQSCNLFLIKVGASGC